MANDVWSEEDIINRTESMIASVFPKTRLDILSRKVQGQAMGYVLTEQEAADLQAYQVVCYQAGTEADAARADMALLAATLAHEVLVQRLAKPEELPFVMTAEVLDEEGNVLEPSVATEEVNPLYEADAAERADATIKIANASAKVLALYLLRNPVVEVVEEVLDEQAA
jgi:hypothetical protein